LLEDTKMLLQMTIQLQTTPMLHMLQIQPYRHIVKPKLHQSQKLLQKTKIINQDNQVIMNINNLNLI